MRLHRQRLARFPELLPVRRVLECFVVFRKRPFCITEFHQHVAPSFERISPVGTLAARELKLLCGTFQILVPDECEPPRVVTRGVELGALNGLFIPSSCSDPIAAMV